MATQPEAETLPQQNPSSTHEDENHQQPPNSQPQSPNFQTLETQDPQIGEQSDPHHQHQAQEHEQQKQDDSQVSDQQDREEQENQEQSGNSPSSRPSAITLTISDPIPPPITSPTNPSRRCTNKRKKGGLHANKQKAIEKKIQTLTENFNPIPFIPSKILDFPKHEKLLKHLGLWDFVHIEFDREIRVDLIAQLIVNYDPKDSKRYVYVNGNRIGVTRPDLARALRLPLKKQKTNPLEGVDLDSEFLSDESKSFIEDFVSNWVLLHEDTWIMPNEVVNLTRPIKELQPEKVDWSSLFWFMVEKELSQGLKLTDCYYASHLQYLIKSQKAEIVMEEPKVEAKEDAGEIELKMGEDLKMGSVNESDGGDDKVVLDKPSTDLTLGQDKIEKEEVKEEEEEEEERMNVDESKEDERMIVDESKEEEPGQHGQWLFDGKNEMGHHFLQPCQFEEESKREDEMGVEEEVEEEEEEEEEMEDGFPIDPNVNGPDPDGDGLTGNLLQSMEETHIPFNLQSQFHDQFSSEIFPSRSNTHTISAGGPSIFGKQEHNVMGGNKRMRTDNMWDQEPSDMGTIMEQIQHLAEKARIMYGAKEQTHQEANMNQQILLNELQQRDRVIEHMHKSKCEEIQKKDAEIFKLERELYMMSNLLEGYRKALKESDKAFFEYRQRVKLPEESVYKDAGPGGVVLGPIELVKQRVKQEEEDRLNRLIIEQKFKEVEEEWIGRFKVELEKVQMMDERLMGFENEVKLMKELCAKKKVQEVSECGPDQSVAVDIAES